MLNKSVFKKMKFDVKYSLYTLKTNCPHTWTHALEESDTVHICGRHASEESDDIKSDYKTWYFLHCSNERNNHTTNIST